MKNQQFHKLVLAISLLLVLPTTVWAQTSIVKKQTENLLDSFDQIVKKHGVGSDTIHDFTFSFRATENLFGHYSRPWETSQREIAGEFWHSNGAFFSRETITRRSASQHRETAFSNETLFRTIDERTAATTKAESQRFLRESCRYTPLVLLSHISDSLYKDETLQDTIQFTQVGTELVVSGSYSGEEYEVLFNDNTLTKIIWTRHHEMLGDQRITMEYSNPKTVDGLTYASSIKESSFGQALFELKVLAAKQSDTRPKPIEQPEDYRLENNEQAVKELIEVDKFSDRVTFLHMTHTDSRTTVVEFKEFLMVIDAPTSSRNGQLILNKIQQMELGKPVKLFAFGHHHPHYLGGVRAFVAAGASILTTKKVIPYLKQLVSFEHTKLPDRLQQNPSNLAVREFEDDVTISDGDYEVKIFDIGLDSHHTIDYLLFYFPEEKMILQGDGINLRLGSPPSRRTRGVYNAIKRLNLDVVDSVQGWPTQNYGIETKLKFTDLESYIQDSDKIQSAPASRN